MTAKLTANGRPIGRRIGWSLDERTRDLRIAIALRVREVQAAIYPRHPYPAMARSLGIPARTWHGNVRDFHAIDGVTILRFITVHRVSPRYLLTGQGPVFEPAETPQAVEGMGMLRGPRDS